MQKNVAGQRIGVQMVSASDGSAFTGSVTVYVTGDAGTQAIGSIGSGICTHEGNGYHSYAPAQAETNYDLIAFTFTGSGAVPVTVQIYTAINPVTAVPTASANATAVRSELTTELGRIDVATSTRLAGASYSAPPSAATIADAVWDEATVDHTSTGSFGAAVGSLSAAAGSGARTVTVTVNDGTNVLQNATVRMTNGGDSYIAVTNASGVCTFNLDDATWTVGITKSGFSYAGTTLVVDGNETVTYSMTATTITPSDVGLVTGYYTCYTEAGVVESGVVISVKCVRVPDAVGLALDSTTRTATSAANGVAQFANMLPGATYEIKRNSGSWFRVKISEDAEDTVQLNSILGP